MKEKYHFENKSVNICREKLNILPKIRSKCGSNNLCNVTAVEVIYDEEGCLILIVGTGNGQVHVFNLDKNEHIKTVTTHHFGDVFSVLHKRCIDEESGELLNYVLIGTWEAIRILDVEKNYEIVVCDGNEVRDYVYGLNNLGGISLTTCSLGCVCVWKMKKRIPSLLERVHKIEVPSYCFFTHPLKTRKNQFVVSCQFGNTNVDDNKNMKICDHETGKIVTQLNYSQTNGYVVCINSFIKKSREFLITGDNESFLVWDLSDYTIINTLKNLRGAEYAFYRRSCLVLENQYMIAELGDRMIGIFDLQTEDIKMVEKVEFFKSGYSHYMNWIVDKRTQTDESTQKNKYMRFLCVGKELVVSPDNADLNINQAMKNGDEKLEDKNAVCFWRIKSSSDWNDIDLKERVEYIIYQFFSLQEEEEDTEVIFGKESRYTLKITFSDDKMMLTKSFLCL